MKELRRSSEAIATVSSKGQVTIPSTVRRALGIEEHDRLLFKLDADGELRIRALKYPTLESLAGAAGSLSGPVPEHLVEAAYQERLGRKYGRGRSGSTPM